MKATTNLNRILLIIRKASILSGALFFWISIQAQEALDIDTTMILTDTIANEGYMYKPIKSSKFDTIQTTDIIYSSDSTLKESKHKQRYYSPKKATIYSAVLPGLGQAYNGKYWKIPIIYVAAYSLLYGYNYWDGGYKFARSKLIEETNKGTNGEGWKIDSYRNSMNTYSKNRGYFIIGMGLLYVLNVVDAMADAYFNSFDISDDLTMRIDPVFIPAPSLALNDGYSYGLRISFNIR